MLIQEAAHEDANIIFGAVIDEDMPEGEMRVTVIATGLDNDRRRRIPLPHGLDRTQVEIERATHRETIPVHTQQAPGAAGAATMADSDGAQAGADFASPFEDEFDTPAFLRRRATEN